MKSRPLITAEDYLIFGKTFLAEFKSKYKCSEDYSHRYLYPQVTLDNINRLLDKENNDIFKRFIVSQATSFLFSTLQNLYDEKYNDYLQRLSCDNAVLKLTGHGECGILAGGMIFSLIQRDDIAFVNRYEINNTLHAFIVITNADSTIEIAIDPFFGFCCPLSEYWKDERVIRYGRAVLQSPHWSPEESPLHIQSYEIQEMKIHYNLLETQINQLMEFSEHPSIKKSMQLCTYGLSLKEPFDREGLTHKLRDIFIKSLSAMAGGVSQAQLLTNQVLPAPKNQTLAKKARTRIEDTSLITQLKIKTNLSFFGVMDDSYHVDAFTKITTNEEIESAKHLQRSTGKGCFFNKGNLFLIENINDGPQTNGEKSTSEAIQKYLLSK